MDIIGKVVKLCRNLMVRTLHELCKYSSISMCSIWHGLLGLNGRENLLR